MKRIMQIVTTVMFCLFIGGFGVLHILLPDRVFSPVENRNLAQLPSFSVEKLVNGEFTADIEEYLADQFPLRDGWMGLKTRYEYVLGKREFNDVYLCGDTLISKVVGSNRAEQNLTYITQLIGKTQIPVYLGMIPTAAEIWKDKLPDGADSFDQQAYLDKAKETGAIWVDMDAILSAHADEPIFYRTDHHWTSLGAYYGYTALMEALGVEPEPLGEKNTVSENFYGTLYSTSGVHWLEPDHIDRYIDSDGITVTVNTGTGEDTHGLYVDSFLSEKDQYSSFLGGNNPLYVIENPNAATDETLLVVRDSFADSLAPFLTQYYKTIHMIDLRYYRMGVAGYAEAIGADAIFICYSVNNFQSDSNMIYLGQ